MHTRNLRDFFHFSVLYFIDLAIVSVSYDNIILSSCTAVIFKTGTLTLSLQQQNKSSSALVRSTFHCSGRAAVLLVTRQAPLHGWHRCPLGQMTHVSHMFLHAPVFVDGSVENQMQEDGQKTGAETESLQGRLQNICSAVWPVRRIYG